MKAAAAFRQQGEACEALGSRMYAELLQRLAHDIDRRGPTVRVLQGHEDDPGPSALALRLLGSVHRLVLERRAGGLAAYYPSVGGHWNAAHGAPAFIRLLDRDEAAVQAWLDRAPQTNEVGRAASLMGGLLHLPKTWRKPVRLFEIGSSGGLNLQLARYSYIDSEGTRFGAEKSPVRLRPAWRADHLVPWPDLEIREAIGSDVMPVDVADAEGRLALTAYVWPDQKARLTRLRGALELAEAQPPEVRRQRAGEFLDEVELEAGTTTVVWHSVMWQYLPTEEQERVTARIEALGAQATRRAPFVHLFLEPTRRDPESRHEFLVVLTTWPGGRRRILGTSAPHGLPVTWGDPG